MPITGQCTAGCGACCRNVMLEVPAAYNEPDVANWLELHGIKLEERAGMTLANIPIQCSALTPEGMCSLFGKPERPELCRVFPRHPIDLIGLEDVCTYTVIPFDEVVIQKVEVPSAN